MKMTMPEYQAAAGLSNHKLQIFRQDPASYVQSLTAPTDPSKTKAASMGTALHTALLEPHLFDDEIEVTSIKGRDTKVFQELIIENPDKVILNEIEAEQVKLMAMSAKCHPTFKSILDADGLCEESIFAACPETGLQLKIRPDKITNLNELPVFNDVKTSKCLEDWRSEVEWKNPLFEMGYGFTAAFYLYVGSIHYGVELQEYNFLVQQNVISMGTYPSTVFKITRQELIDYGFWDDMIGCLRWFKQVQDSGDWNTYESFHLNKQDLDDGGIEIEFIGDKQ